MPLTYHIWNGSRRSRPSSTRAAPAAFQRPVLLYSIGIDSSVILQLARKAFPPARLQFPLLHVDTTWEAREMILYRDATARRLGLDLTVHVNEDRELALARTFE